MSDATTLLASQPLACPKCGENASHEMPLRQYGHRELWCPNAHYWFVPLDATTQGATQEESSTSPTTAPATTGDKP